jgi:hypothetical protein
MSMRARLAVFILGSGILIASACAQGVRSENTDDDGSGLAIGVGGGGGGTQDPNGPQFVSFEADVEVLHEGETATFTAVLTDPQGVTDITGGTLKDESGAIYGAFVPTRAPGTFTLLVNWDGINLQAPIDFAYNSSLTRTFVAEFADMADHTITSQTLLELACTNGWASCGGSCLDTTSDILNCGSCGNDCASDACAPGGSCINSMCQGGAPLDCSYLDDGQCVVGMCQSGSCIASSAPVNTPCNDLNTCTGNDVCSSSGTCGGTTITSCISADGCCPVTCNSSNDSDCTGCTSTNLGSTSPQTTSGSTSALPNNFSGSCGGSSAPEKIYSFTAPSTGQYTIDTIGSSYDTLIYVRTGSCGGSELACDDDAGGNLTSLVTVSLTIGQVVYIFVDGYSTNSGSFQLHIGP